MDFTNSITWNGAFNSVWGKIWVRMTETFKGNTNKHEMLCTVILICNKMKSQNLDKKTIEDLQNCTSKTNIKTFARKKNLFIKMSMFFNWKKHQTNPISRLFIYRAKNKLVKWDANNSYMYKSLTGLQFRKTYRVASQSDVVTLSSNVFPSCTIQNNCGNFFNLDSRFAKVGRRLGYWGDPLR